MLSRRNGSSVDGLGGRGVGGAVAIVTSAAGVSPDSNRLSVHPPLRSQLRRGELIRDRCNGELQGEVRDPVPPDPGGWGSNSPGQRDWSGRGKLQRPRRGATGQLF